MKLVAGPIIYKQHNGRKSPNVNHTSLFVDLKLLTDLNSDAYLAALNSFVARRGLCGHKQSDNGTNLQGAAKKLGEIYKTVKDSEFNNNVSNSLGIKGILQRFYTKAQLQNQILRRQWHEQKLQQQQWKFQ